MKIIGDNGERITIQVSHELGTSHSISIQTKYDTLIDIQIVDGLIGKVEERVVRRDGTDRTGR